MLSIEESEDLSTRATRFQKHAVIHKLTGPDNYFIKPSPSDPNYDMWIVSAKVVISWITRHLTFEIYRRVRIFAPSNAWPDEYLEAVRGAVLGTGHYSVRRLWFEAIFIQRSDYDTIEDFVLALEKKINLSRAVDMDITPFQATMLLLENIKEEMPVYVELKFIQLPRDSRKTMSKADFYDIAREVRDIASVKRLGDASSSKEINSKNLPPKRSPLKGQSADDHLRYWFGRRRRSPNNLCPYCREGKHDTEHCPYLSRLSRSLYWSPRPNIWWLK